jgi:hypothetical protein
MDAETFGHHIKGWEREFLDATYHLLIHEESSGPKGVQMAFPSDLVRNFPSGGLIEPYASSWSTSPDDLAKHNPFPLWKAPGNTLHAMQWELADHCIYLESAARQFSSSPVARKFSRLASERLEPALHSCQFWWASRRPMWDFTMILRGFLILTEVSLDAAHALHLTSLPADVAQEVRWRGAAANELRARIERDLKESPES